MPRESAKDKALRLIGDGRVKLDRDMSNKHRLVFHVIGDSDPFGPYTVTCEYDGGLLVESCTCEGGQHHPIRGKCSHVEAARLICGITQSPVPNGGRK